MTSAIQYAAGRAVGTVIVFLLDRLPQTRGLVVMDHEDGGYTAREVQQ